MQTRHQKTEQKTTWDICIKTVGHMCVCVCVCVCYEPGGGQAEESVRTRELLPLGGEAHGHMCAVHVLCVHQLLPPHVVVSLHKYGYGKN